MSRTCKTETTLAGVAGVTPRPLKENKNRQVGYHFGIQ